MILHGRIVDQLIDRQVRGTFQKEVVVAPGPVPLAMVRKRWAANDGGTIGTVLLIHGFGQNRYAWHLPSRSLANHLARAGFDVYNLDLRGHGRSRHLGAKRPAGVIEYIEEDLPIAIEEVQRHAGTRPVFLVGHSLGGLVSYAAAPALGAAVGGIVSIGSPYHFTRGSYALGGVALFMRALSVVASGAGKRSNLPIFMGPMGVMMKAFRRVAEHPLYPIPLRGWHAGALEPHILEEHLRLAFDRASLAEMMNMFEWANDKQFGGKARDVARRFEAMDLPLLVIAGTNDDLAPPPSVRPAYLRSRSKDKTYRVLPLGHIDLLVGRDAPLMTWPLVASWMKKRVA